MNLQLPVADASYVSAARREVEALVERLGFGSDDRGRAALVTTELATNLARHGGGGVILALSLPGSGMQGLELIALDRGSGIADVGASLRDGVSTSGVSGPSAGSGLGAIRRMSDEFDIHSVPGRGTAVLARLWAQHQVPPGRGPLQVGHVSVPKTGERVCGDAISVVSTAAGLAALVADGLGHGEAANTAAEAARRLFVQTAPAASPLSIVRALHAGLGATRGAAVGVLGLDLAASRATFCGVGNIAGLALADDSVRRFVSMNGIAGHTAGRIQEFVYPCDGRNLVVVLHSDGLSTHWDLAAYPGLRTRHASLIAAVLYRDAGRVRDDATVLVIKRPA